VKLNKAVVIILILSIACLMLGVASAAQEKAPDSVVLKGAAMGGVKFDHKKHAADAKCDTCHHPAKPEKAAKSPNQRCQDCHTTAAAAPMKTKAQAAFHNPAATQGACIDCHKKENLSGKKAPTKCTECHQKANT
jgi:hypothetical protein